MKRASYKFSEKSIDSNPSITNRDLYEGPRSNTLNENVICAGSSKISLPLRVSTSRALSPNYGIDQPLVDSCDYDDHHVATKTGPRCNYLVEGCCNADGIKYSNFTNKQSRSNNNECLFKPNTSAEISVHCREGKKKKSLIYFIRKKINNAIENCSYKKSSDSNRSKFKKCRSLEVLASNFSEPSSPSITENPMSGNFEFKRPYPCSQSMANDTFIPALESSLKLPSMSIAIDEQSLSNIGLKNINSLESPLLRNTPSIATKNRTSQIDKSSTFASNHVPFFENMMLHFQPVGETCNNQSNDKEDLVNKNNCLSCEPQCNLHDNFPESSKEEKDQSQELQNDDALNECESSSTEKLASCQPAMLCNSSDIVVKSLTEELRELVKYGWYWGSMNRKEAEDKLNEEADGTFLVRDSSDVKYLYTLSFKSYGKTFHTRIEHSNGWFSFYPQPDNDGRRSLVKLIEHCISESDAGVFCYSRPLLKGSPSFPVRLIKPISRFMEVRSLQYLCRFVIRRFISINNIQNLPAPMKIKRYLEESYY